jgi:WD40 repeat protein
MPTKRYPTLLSLLVVLLTVLAGCGESATPTGAPVLPPPTATLVGEPPTDTVVATLPPATVAGAPATPATPTLPPATPTIELPTASPISQATATSPAPGTPTESAATGALPTQAVESHGAPISAGNVGALAVAWTQTEKTSASAPVFSLDGHYLGVADGMHLFHLLLAGDGHEVRAVAGDTGAFSPDGATLATADKQAISLWRLDNGAQLQRTPLDPFAGLAVPVLAYAPAGVLFAAGSDRVAGQVFLWRGLADLAHPETIEPDDAAESLLFSPDRRILAVGTANVQTELWQVDNGTRLGLTSPHGRGVDVLAWSPDGAIIADASHERTVQLWRASDLSPIRQLAAVTRVSALRFSPDGTLLAVGTNTAGISRDATENVVEIWDVAGGKKLRTLTGIEEGITGLAFAPDGSLLAATTDAGTCRVWQVR